MNMGLVREPKHIDFVFEDRQIPEEELKAFRAMIARNKQAAAKRRKTARPKTLTRTRTKTESKAAK
ncbi:MAG TPA: hypothetical protein PKE53_05490 [Flavobacteriales bacterium]|jgi:hypothetical protein|nr:hypothetical protein [Flavobacteriales bacterium]